MTCLIVRVIPSSNRTVWTHEITQILDAARPSLHVPQRETIFLEIMNTVLSFVQLRGRTPQK